MNERQKVFLYGHSFPARLLRWSTARAETVERSVGISDKCSMFVEGHPGLSFDRVLANENHYFRKLRTHSIDVLCIDLGTNDLCSIDGTPQVVVE